MHVSNSCGDVTNYFAERREHLRIRDALETGVQTSVQVQHGTPFFLQTGPSVAQPSGRHKHSVQQVRCAYRKGARLTLCRTDRVIDVALCSIPNWMSNVYVVDMIDAALERHGGTRRCTKSRALVFGLRVVAKEGIRTQIPSINKCLQCIIRFLFFVDFLSVNAYKSSSSSEPADIFFSL
jgi:hypothetical protein